MMEQLLTNESKFIMDITFENLMFKCLEARRKAEAAREEQLELEKQILSLPMVQDNLKFSGTTQFKEGALKIVTKINQKWDQKKLSDVIKNNEWSIMAFDIEYKPNAARLKLLKEDFPEQFKKLAACLTETPAKPYFIFGEE